LLPPSRRARRCRRPRGSFTSALRCGGLVPAIQWNSDLPKRINFYPTGQLDRFRIGSVNGGREHSYSKARCGAETRGVARAFGATPD
jgi:hypothetical protein